MEFFTAIKGFGYRPMKSVNMEPLGAPLKDSFIKTNF